MAKSDYVMEVGKYEMLPPSDARVFDPLGLLREPQVSDHV